MKEKELLHNIKSATSKTFNIHHTWLLHYKIFNPLATLLGVVYCNKMDLKFNI